ncbi:MAG: peptidase S51 [Gemmatimonadales bacterium]|nr:MAG: peptidase S51 [Gemmatimonadales bacterium]
MAPGSDSPPPRPVLGSSARRGIGILALLVSSLLVWGCFGGGGVESESTAPAESPLIGPASGSLIVAGGGTLGPEIWARFVELAGGPEARIVVIPTAGADDHFDDGWSGLEPLRRAGAVNVSVLHTRDRVIANDSAFTAPLEEATGVWFPGGRQWRLVDAYLGTRVHEQLFGILDRGGVVGGTSAGASIQASFLVRGDPETNQVLLSPDYEEGFGFLSHSAVDQHLLARGREEDLWELLALRPDLLGIGIDEGTALVIQGDRAEVIGVSQALFYDPNGPIRRARSLQSGAIFDLGRRMPLPRTAQEIDQQQDGQDSPLQR